MQEWLCGLTAALAGITVGLAVKLFLMKKACVKSGRAWEERLNQETNTLLDTASRDRDLLALQEALNDQLREIAGTAARYQQGDQQLKQSLTQITHDLRTPLTAICGYLQLAEAEPASPRLKQILAILSERAQTLKRLSEQLFHYSVAVCDPPKAVRQLIDLRQRWRKISPPWSASLRSKAFVRRSRCRMSRCGGRWIPKRWTGSCRIYSITLLNTEDQN